jgi:hypothetical protein
VIEIRFETRKLNNTQTKPQRITARRKGIIMGSSPFPALPFCKEIRQLQPVPGNNFSLTPRRKNVFRKKQKV